MVSRQRQPRKKAERVEMEDARPSTVDKHGSSRELEKSLTGRTPDGKAFAVPKTHDMMQSLFNPLTPKTTFDLFTLGVLSTHLFVFLVFPLQTKRMVLMLSFAFWRICYNGGLGWILNWQSNHYGLVAFFKRNGWLDKKRGGKIYGWLKAELEAKMGPDYSFESVPIEFNVWLLYRQLVDLILLNDFTAYFFFCACYLGSANDTESWQTFLRIFGGITLLAFNLWVKVDAHRVVKDYAWYWGDFFFLVEQSLTFDGVFEMAPHPMYSIGYAGYYGGSLITGSYTIFYASLAAHMLQFLFLSLVENPHIEKTYERPPLAVQVLKKSRLRRLPTEGKHLDQAESNDEVMSTASSISAPSSANALSIRERPTSLWHPELIVFKNFNPLRASDLFIVLLLAYSIGVPLLFLWTTGSRSIMLTYSVIQCIGWILFRTLALGFLLKKQSTEQLITKWFIKRGGNSEEAFSSWRAIYNATSVMTYGSFILVAVAAYHWDNAEYGNLILFHTLGLLLISFHIWSSISVYDTLGDFGWFYGDFFARNPSMLSLAPSDLKLYYSGIYRYLNNPDKVIGQAAFYGLSLISRSWSVFALALFLQCCNFLFGAYVESPHMKKVYGAQVRRDSGIVRTVKRAVNKGIGQPVFDDNEDTEFSDGSEDGNEIGRVVDLLTLKTKPVRDMLLETKDILSTTTARIAEKAIPSELSKLSHLDLYGIKLNPGVMWKSPRKSRTKSKRQSDKTGNDDEPKNTYYLGEPIRVSWYAPIDHSRKDWVGIYPVTANFSNQITTVSSKGHYVYIHPDENLLAEMVPGDSVFAGNVKSIATARNNSRLNSTSNIFSELKRKEGDTNNQRNTGRKSGQSASVLQGEIVFSSDALPFKVGAYEMRLHHGGTHAVLSQSKPFEIIATKYQGDILSSPTNDDLSLKNASTQSSLIDTEDLTQALLIVVNKCLAVTDTHASTANTTNSTAESGMAATSLDPVFMPRMNTEVIEPLTSSNEQLAADNVLDDKQAKRLSYAIKEYFDVEFDPSVLIHAAKHGATIDDVAARVSEARKALSEYSSINFKS